jgi:hypothetical protein
LNRSAISWAFGWALRFVIAAAVIALLLAAVLSGEAAERVASAAYLAAVFAAVVFVLQRFLPVTDLDGRGALRAPGFPALIAFAFGIAIFLSVLAGLTSQPGAEALALVTCFGLVAVAALVRNRIAASLNRARADGFAQTAAYGALASIAAMIVAALLPAPAEGLATTAYLAAVVAAFAVAVECWRRA